jgi:hypothetical protein
MKEGEAGGRGRKKDALCCRVIKWSGSRVGGQADGASEKTSLAHRFRYEGPQVGGPGSTGHRRRRARRTWNWAGQACRLVLRNQSNILRTAHQNGWVILIGITGKPIGAE